MKTIGILVAAFILFSVVGAGVAVSAAPFSQGASVDQKAETKASMYRERPLPEGEVSTNLTLTTSNAALHVGQAFTLSGRLSVSNGSSTGVEALKLYRSVNDGEYALCRSLTTNADSIFSQNFTYNTAVTLKYYAVFDPTKLYRGSQSNIVTVTVTNAT